MVKKIVLSIVVAAVLVVGVVTVSTSNAKNTASSDDTYITNSPAGAKLDPGVGGN